MSDPRPEKQTPDRTAGQPQRLPHPDLCRAKYTGFADHVNCVTPHQWSCQYAVPFGLGYLCLHSDRLGIAARTPGGAPPQG